jgi:hypothetical protein
MIRWIRGVLVVGLLVLGFVAWKRSMEPARPADAGTSPAAGASIPPPGMPDGGGSPQDVGGTTEDALAASGIQWKTPSGWREGGPRAMRLATYFVGGPEPETTAECSVFHFGPGMGGNLDDNIERWVGQFDGSPNYARRVLTVHGLRVTRVEIAGTFLAPDAEMQSQGKRPGWKMLGAIVEGPQGAVFFKLTGPGRVIDGATRDFDALLASLGKR